MPVAPPREAAGFLSDPAASGTRHPLLGRGGRRVRVGLEDLLAGLTGPDAVALLDREHEHLPVAHGAGARVLEDRVDDRLHVAVGDHALELHLRAQVVGQLRPAVALGDPLLPPEPLTSLMLSDGKPRVSSSMRIGSNASWRM